MATALGRRAPRVTAVRSLRTPKGRREGRRFFFEGATLLHEAARSGVHLEALYVTAAAYAGSALVREMEAGGTPTFCVDDRTFASLSDVETPSGILAVAKERLDTLPALLARTGVLLVLADLNDPGNAGTLVRSAEAFGASGVLFGSLGVDPWHPKVVRAAMGSLFRMPVGVGSPPEFAAALATAGSVAFGLVRAGTPIERVAWPQRCALAVGHERHGLAAWEAACSQMLSVAMRGPVESLNAAVAGSIGLYEASKNRR